jgi:hypothetical protein
MMALSSTDRLVDFVALSLVGKPATNPRRFHFATASRLIPERLAKVLRLSWPCCIARPSEGTVTAATFASSPHSIGGG